MLNRRNVLQLIAGTPPPCATAALIAGPFISEALLLYQDAIKEACGAG